MTTSKVGPKGQVVIPKHVRDALGIEPGGLVEIEQDGSEVRVRKHASIDSLRGMLPPAEGGLGDLERSHAREMKREDAKYSG